MNHKYLLFIHIPKTGGEFIQSKYKFYQHWKNSKIYKNVYKLKKFENNDNFTFGHADIKTILENKIISKDFYNKSFKFCIVRNPYDRFLSIYLYFLKSTESGKNILDNNISFDKFINIIHNLKEKIPKNSDQNVEVHSDYFFLRNHLNIQKSWIPEDINKIYKFEDGFDILLNDIKEQVNINSNNMDTIPINKCNKKNKKFYNENNYKKVYEIYEKDFLEFNYDENSYVNY